MTGWYTMNRSLFCTVLALVVFFSTPVVRSQDDPNLLMMKRIYSKFGSMLSVSSQSTTGYTPGQTILILLNPGIFVDPDTDETTPAGRLAIAQILNRLPKPSWMYEDSGNSVDSVYSRMMADSEAVFVEPTQGQVAQLAAARKILYADEDRNPSAAYQRYIDKRKDYDDADDACEADRGTQPVCKSSLRNKKAAALEAWETSGRKNEIESALQQEHQLTQTAAGWFTQERGRFARASETADGIPFRRVLSSPPYKQWSGDKGWSTYKLTDTLLTTQIENSRVTSSVSGGVNYGLWSVGGGSFSSTNRSYKKSTMNGVEIEVELRRVMLFRPWLDTILFQSDRWRFNPQSLSANLKVSDGRGGVSTVPTGLMPLYPTGVLLSRRVKLSGIDSTEIESSLSEQKQVSGSVGWGPFRIGGNREEKSNKEWKQAKKVANGLEVADVQIIGFYCEVLRETPKPTTDPTVKWLTDPARLLSPLTRR